MCNNGGNFCGEVKVYFYRVHSTRRGGKPGVQASRQCAYAPMRLCAYAPMYQNRPNKRTGNSRRCISLRRRGLLSSSAYSASARRARVGEWRAGGLDALLDGQGRARRCVGDSGAGKRRRRRAHDARRCAPSVRRNARAAPVACAATQAGPSRTTARVAAQQLAAVCLVRAHRRPPVTCHLSPATCHRLRQRIAAERQ